MGQGGLSTDKTVGSSQRARFPKGAIMPPWAF